METKKLTPNLPHKNLSKPGAPSGNKSPDIAPAPKPTVPGKKK